MWSCARISSAVFTTAACSSPSPRAPHLSLASATARVRSGTLRPEEAHHLFDQLLRQATPIPERSLNGFLSALARAPSSAACRDGPALAVALFNRASRADGSRPTGAVPHIPHLWHPHGLLHLGAPPGANAGLLRPALQDRPGNQYHHHQQPSQGPL
ncbi:unnamed protein product [Miscanthus lutarioriparius]|uniref:Uncharacterized protein n=1 Tax=Miscanthus lutarioriparius TaxID=422564 RepID=A0A811QI54_9POAL|nr:unnamed protein product [Miscanthus lutarioriparius]